jgi:hypothetical protein
MIEASKTSSAYSKGKESFIAIKNKPLEWHSEDRCIGYQYLFQDHAPAMNTHS